MFYIIIFIILLFIASPLVTILLYTTTLLKENNCSKKQLWFLASLLSVYLGFLASTKEKSGDLEEYIMYFMNVPQFDLLSYLFEYGKEPLYYGYTWISYYLFNGNYILFTISFTAINYLLISYCIIRIAKHYKMSHRTAIITLFLMAFFFQEFAATGNLVRQAISEAITLVFLTELYLTKQKKWWIALCAVCVHSSCIPVLAIGIIPTINKYLSFKKIALIIVLIVIMAVFFYLAGSHLSSIPFIGYVFSRASNSEQLLGTDSWQEEVGLNMSTTVLLIILGVMCILLYKKLNKQKFSFNGMGLININMILITFMIVCNYIGAYYLLMRYYFWIYVFMNVLVLLYFHYSKIAKDNMFQISFILLLTIYFFYEFSHNIFSYIPVGDAILRPLPYYF